jgi:hypothetical protein
MSRAAVIGATLLVVVLAGCGGGGTKSQSSYVKSNAGLLANLPTYPHAKLIRKATTGYTTGGKKIVGYQTRYIFSLPARASLQSVEAYYLKNMTTNSWKQVASLTGPVLNYRKGKAFVSVNLSEVRTHQLELLVDNGFYSHIKK